ncbi:MAG TPA: guanylate kinase [Candidatus Mcinerneyibacteriales bacterium]|nr:guanylate kinase [Candidatus Mcinerneyibacteriales bacterium]HPQ88793.1 guanylate kinase [Candidatus Mcinerneyibacteriales bacterium]
MKGKPQKNFNSILLVLSAPSGAGKTTLARKFLEKHPDFGVSVSYTTRKPRRGEKEGIHYYFTDPQTFQEMIARKEFVEWAHVHDDWYGTPFSEIQRLHGQGKGILFDIDIQGGVNIYKAYPDRTLLVFILPPSMEELERRLRNRKTDDEKTIEKRLKNAQKEISIARDKYDYFLVNDDLEEALKELEMIVAFPQEG